MTALRTLLACLSVALVVGVGPPGRGDGGVLDDAGQVFLGLLDEGRYGDAWQESAEMLKHEVDRDAWVESMQRLRVDLGSFRSRTLVGKEYQPTDTAPGGYVFLLRYQTDFTGTPGVLETLTVVMEDESGPWRAAGYAVRRP
jgi:Protein of unknown function (DUF4019)